MTKQHHITMADIARAAGVDNSTVSLALRGDVRITEATRVRIRQAATRLGYVTNNLARSLSSRRSRLIGVLLTDAENHFFAAPLEEIHEHAGAAGYAVSVKFSGWETARERLCLRQFCESRVDGLIWATAFSAADVIDAEVTGGLSAGGVPIVTLGNELLLQQGLAHCVGMQTATAIQCGIDHLTALGHQRIGLATAAAADSLRGRMHRDRIGWARAALANAGCLLPAADIFDTADNQYGGVALAAQLAQRPRTEWPSAIFAFDDMLARALIAGLAALGVHVPGEISVLGFDDAPGDTEGPVPITSVSLEARAVGRQAIGLLLGLLDGSVPPKPMHSVVLQPRITVRASCAPYTRPPQDGKRL